MNTFGPAVPKCERFGLPARPGSGPGATRSKAGDNASGALALSSRPFVTAVAGSMVNRVIGRPMAKKQPMRGGRRGAHRLVQIRVAILEGGLQDLF